MPRLISERGRRTSWLVWLAAIVCAILAIVVIITSIIVLAIYLIYQPRMPYIKVAYAQLNNLGYDQSGLLEIEMALKLVVENDNTKVHAIFSDQSFILQFHGIDVAELPLSKLDLISHDEIETIGDVSPRKTEKMTDGRTGLEAIWLSASPRGLLGLVTCGHRWVPPRTCGAVSLTRLTDSEEPMVDPARDAKRHCPCYPGRPLGFHGGPAAGVDVSTVAPPLAHFEKKPAPPPATAFIRH
ncbi:hypothetical protein GW17_00032564 [Ensete ventricosum]|nr:hypothetical protein GW17_00032564 [Ensete ventricosum]